MPTWCPGPSSARRPTSRPERGRTPNAPRATPGWVRPWAPSLPPWPAQTPSWAPATGGSPSVAARARPWSLLATRSCPSPTTCCPTPPLASTTSAPITTNHGSTGSVGPATWPPLSKPSPVRRSASERARSSSSTPTPPEHRHNQPGSAALRRVPSACPLTTPIFGSDTRRLPDEDRLQTPDLVPGASTHPTHATPKSPEPTHHPRHSTYPRREAPDHSPKPLISLALTAWDSLHRFLEQAQNELAKEIDK